MILLNFFNFNFSKKGQGLSLNVVVLAALALIVLVVLTAIFGGKIRDSTQKGEDSTNDFLWTVCANIENGECRSCGDGNSGQGKFVDCGSKECCFVGGQIQN